VVVFGLLGGIATSVVSSGLRFTSGLLGGVETTGAAVDEVHKGVDDHHGPHSKPRLHAIARAVLLVVEFDGKGAAGGVHDGSGEAEQRFQQVVGVVEEDVSDEEGDADEQGGAYGDDTCVLPVIVAGVVAQNAGIVAEVEVVLSQQADADKGQDNLNHFEDSLGGEKSFDIERETHFWNNVGQNANTQPTQRDTGRN